jgi:5-methylcytosine-specific restriction endonuclease McrA
MPDPFYSTRAWQKLRGKVRARWKWKDWPCGICHELIDWNAKPVADHIRPRKEAPELELVETNIQMVCHGCNTRKGKGLDPTVRTGLDGFPAGWGDA